MALVIFLVSFVLLTSSIFYTRLFSILYWHSSAFAVLTLALLGLAASGLFIFFNARIFSESRVRCWICWLLGLFSLSIIFSYLGVLAVSQPSNVFAGLAGGFMKNFLPPAFITFFPFFMGGLIVSLILFRFHRDVSRLYFFDMMGATCGAMCSLTLLSLFNGTDLVWAMSLAIALAAAACAWQWKYKAALVFSVFCTGIALSYAAVPVLHKQLVITYSKKGKEKPFIYERWAPAARIKVIGNKKTGMEFQIDSGVVTPILPYSGKYRNAGYLKHNVLQLGYRLGPYDKVVIIGPGGGSDVLSALTSGNQDITAVEINSGIVDIMRGPLASYNGNIYNRPQVHLTIDEGRSYLASMDGKVDFIQATFIDTYAAAASGAHTLSENYLYTTDAFHDYLDRLNDNGIISISRWGGSMFGYEEILRIVALAQASLTRYGIENPGDHIVVVQGGDTARLGPSRGYQGNGATAHMATALISKSPFTPQQLDVINHSIRQFGFTPLWIPGNPKVHPVIAGIFETNGSTEFYTHHYHKSGLDISPIDDDKPFFFSMLRPQDYYWSEKYLDSENKIFFGKYAPVYALHKILYSLLVLGGLFIALPLFLRRADIKPLRQTRYFIGFFSCLGLGFMGIELGLMQRFSLFLGHPVYALVVVLASLLCFTALGSLMTERLHSNHARYAFYCGAALVGLLMLCTGLPVLLPILMGLPFILKVCIAMLVIAPLGVLMGTLYPLGIKVLSASGKEHLIPWMWGLNTGFSVIATVISLYLSMSAGFSFAWQVFVLVYACGCLCMARVYRQKPV
ncbi:MAG: hypothetical protein AB7L92_06800 [Alphaproteobacteria bacterium]